MGWKFWQRNDEKDTLTIKLPKPKEIPEKIGEGIWSSRKKWTRTSYGSLNVP
jgi:hypothetical protein